MELSHSCHLEAEKYLRNLLNTAYEVERQDYQIHLAKGSKHAKTAKEWWDESGFGTVLYYGNSDLKLVLLGETSDGRILTGHEKGSWVPSACPDTILSDKPPKKKVKKYLWVYKESDDSYHITNRLYKDESSALKHLDYKNTIIQRIDASVIEVEE